jgi:hypothetical protein
MIRAPLLIRVFPQPGEGEEIIEPDSLPVLSQLQGQDACQPLVAEPLGHLSHHGGHQRPLKESSYYKKF